MWIDCGNQNVCIIAGLAPCVTQVVLRIREVRSLDLQPDFGEADVVREVDRSTWHMSHIGTYTQRRGRFVTAEPCCTRWRREWDSNPRKVALHTLSKRADSAALAPLLNHWPAAEETTRPETQDSRPLDVSSPTKMPSECVAGSLEPRWITRRVRWRPGPVQWAPVNQVRTGR
jgi:hypothetical protein